MLCNRLAISESVINKFPQAQKALQTIPRQVQAQRTQPNFTSNSPAIESKPTDTAERLTNIEKTLAQVLDYVKFINGRLSYIPSIQEGERRNSIEYL